MRAAALRLAALGVWGVVMAPGIGTATFATAARAQEAPLAADGTVQQVQSPVLTLERERLFRETLFGKSVEARIKAESDALIAENLRLEQALETEERDLTDRRAALPAADFQRLAAAFDTKAEQIRAAQQSKATALASKREGEQQRFLVAAVPVLRDLMREREAAAIFDKNMIILSLRAIDITDDAIARIDAVLGNGDAPAAAPEANPAPPETAPPESAPPESAPPESAPTEPDAPKPALPEPEPQP